MGSVILRRDFKMSGGSVAVCCLALREDKHQMPTLMWQRLSRLMNTATRAIDLGALLGKLWVQWDRQSADPSPLLFTRLLCMPCRGEPFGDICRVIHELSAGASRMSQKTSFWFWLSKSISWTATWSLDLVDGHLCVYLPADSQGIRDGWN